MEKNVKVCTDCPFRSISYGGGHNNGRVVSLRRRYQLSCNLQPNLGTQWRADGNYTCFKTCPLKKESVTVEMENVETNKIIKSILSIVNDEFECISYTKNISFEDAEKAIVKFRDELQRQIDNKTQCPFNKQ